MKKIAVCVPTYNESDIIETTVKKIDNGLQYYDSTYETYIVNCDNSIDETGKIFQNLKIKWAFFNFESLTLYYFM